MEAPETRYVARPDGVSIAYQVFGDGPVDLIYVPGFVSHLDLAWTDARLAQFLTRLASFARVVTFDKPGTGASDPVTRVPTLEERAADVRTVLDAVGFQRAALLGFSEGGPTCLVFAATWPERVTALVTYGSLTKAHPTDDELAAMGHDRAVVEDRWRRFHAIGDAWGTGASMDMLAPSHAGSPAERRLWALFERAAASPKMVRAIIAFTEQIDVTAVLPAVQAPTLVLHRVDDFVPIAFGRLLAAGVPGARLVELPGSDHAFWLGDAEPVVREIEQFLTGATRPVESDRVLATVMFSDLVGSTERAAQLGDSRWSNLLDRYALAVRQRVERDGGRVVDSAGDGHLSVFSRPGRAVECAHELRRIARADDLSLRIGIHTGECQVMGEGLGGMAVHIGARVAALAAPDEVLVSGTVKDLLVGSSLAFKDGGEHALKGVPGTWRIYAAEPGGDRPPVPAERELRPGDRMILGLAQRSPKAARGAAALSRLLARRVSDREMAVPLA